MLDVSVMLALATPSHDFHHSARRWWHDSKNRGWASCPLTQNGFVRILSQPSYPGYLPFKQTLSLLNQLTVEPGHQFWPDGLSLADETVFNHAALQSSHQITDAYLLALAVRNGGRLVTFDRRLSIAVVHDARLEHLVVLPAA